MSRYDQLKIYKHEAKRAARDLGYPLTVSCQITSANSIGEVERIMINARHADHRMVRVMD